MEASAIWLPNHGAKSLTQPQELLEMELKGDCFLQEARTLLLPQALELSVCWVHAVCAWEWKMQVCTGEMTAPGEPCSASQLLQEENPHLSY